MADPAGSLDLGRGQRLPHPRPAVAARTRGTPEEILLRLRELQSGYEYEISFGISYSFGSIFSSIVNPRFGQ
ncbi:hypothetical protein BH18ACI5_BH18ACI5_26540 [soil metagenome]